MIKRIPCKVVPSASSGQHFQGNNAIQPPAPCVSNSALDDVYPDEKNWSFPVGMFVDVIIGD